MKRATRCPRGFADRRGRRHPPGHRRGERCRRTRHHWRHPRRRGHTRRARCWSTSKSITGSTTASRSSKRSRAVSPSPPPRATRSAACLCRLRDVKLHLEKPWLELSAERVAKLPGQMGVYQLADDSRPGRSTSASPAARSLFGLRSELESADWALRTPSATKSTMQYQTRWRELLMLHRAPTRRRATSESRPSHCRGSARLG